MGKLAVGSVVLVSFPLSNLKGQKRRPALILAKVEFNNYVLCQITSRPYSSKKSIIITEGDFECGKLPFISFVRPDKLFTADKTLIKGVVGELNEATIKKILRYVSTLFKS